MQDGGPNAGSLGKKKQFWNKVITRFVESGPCSQPTDVRNVMTIRGDFSRPSTAAALPEDGFRAGECRAEFPAKRNPTDVAPASRQDGHFLNGLSERRPFSWLTRKGRSAPPTYPQPNNAVAPLGYVQPVPVNTPYGSPGQNFEHLVPQYTYYPSRGGDYVFSGQGPSLTASSPLRSGYGNLQEHIHQEMRHLRPLGVWVPVGDDVFRVRL